MGMYTKIQFVGRIKTEYIQAIIDGNNESSELWEESVNGNTYWKKNAGVWYRINSIKNNPKLQEMGLAHRSDEMFFGDWTIVDENLLIFHSEIKDYHGESRIFSELLDFLFDIVYVYRTKYEEDDDWYYYKSLKVEK